MLKNLNKKLSEEEIDDIIEEYGLNSITLKYLLKNGIKTLEAEDYCQHCKIHSIMTFDIKTTVTTCNNCGKIN